MKANELIRYILYKFLKYDSTKDDFNYEYRKNKINEEWKVIYNFNYECSNYGRIRNITTKNIKELKISKYGNQVILWKNSIGYTFTISRLVANLFIREVQADERVLHINGDIRNNYYKNLKIINKKEGINNE